MDKKLYFDILNKELVIALGCTEPIAIAFAAALARKHVKGDRVTLIKVSASGNVIKNAMSVSIPGTGGSGINLAAALGSLAKDSGKSLEILAGLTGEDIENAKRMIKEGTVNVEVAGSPKKLYIEVLVKTAESYSRVVIEDAHTNVTLIEADGQIIKQQADQANEGYSEDDSGCCLDLDSIWEFVGTVDTTELGLIRQSIDMNLKIGLEGLANPYGLQVGRILRKSMEAGLVSDDLSNYAMALTAAGSDARMAGGTLPVMSNSGSGNQGISATLPVVAAAEKMKSTDEQMVRAVTLSHLITIYIKSKFGRLSALCGATISATGASCGVTYILGGGLPQIKAAIQNMLGNVTGMLCDGAKPGCALKISTCTNAAIQSALIAMQGIEIQSTDGIIENNPEQTIENLCRLGNQGTLEADRIILDIMLKKTNC